MVTCEKLAPLLHDRIDRPLFIIDIAVPRDVAPEVHEMEGVFLYDIDSLQSIAQQSLALRRQQIVAGEEIIARHIDDLTAGSSPRGSELAPGPLRDPALRPSET